MGIEDFTPVPDAKPAVAYEELASVMEAFDEIEASARELEPEISALLRAQVDLARSAADARDWHAVEAIGRALLAGIMAHRVMLAARALFEEMSPVVSIPRVKLQEALTNAMLEVDLSNETVQPEQVHEFVNELGDDVAKVIGKSGRTLLEVTDA
jgi:hypothetical protein